MEPPAFHQPEYQKSSRQINEEKISIRSYFHPTATRKSNLGFDDYFPKDKYIKYQLMTELRNIKGGGLHYVADFESTQTKLFRAGLKHYTANHERLIKGSRVSPNQGYHDQIDYERGCVIHSRSPSNQQLNFHYMYGGVKKFFVDRWLVGSIYRNGFRIMWFPGFLYFIFGCYGMRLYDNAAHDFFYFSD